MVRPDSPWWDRPFFLITALALFLLHVLLLGAAAHFSAFSFISNLIQLAFGILLTLATWNTARKSEGFARIFWKFQASGFLLWVAAQGLATVYNDILKRPITEPWPSDVFFFIWMTPAFLSLFLNSNSEEQERDPQQWLDFAQVIILVVAGYLFTFEVPSHWQKHGISIHLFGLLLEYLRQAFAIAVFSIRSWTSRSPLARALYGRIAIFFTLYSAAEAPYLYLQDYRDLHPGTIWDLPWSFAFLIGIFLVVRPISEAVQQKELARGSLRESPRKLSVLLKLVPLIFPLVVLLMAANIAEEQFGVAVGAVIASFACSSARIILAERRQRQSAQELEERSALLKGIFEGTEDGIYLKDLKGRYLLVNQSFANFLRRPKEEIIGKTVADLLESGTAARITADDKTVIESGTTHAFTEEVHIHERVKTVLSTKSPHRDAKGNIVGLIALVRDITDYRHMEERLRQSQKMEAVGTLAGGVAHDFNNILMVISGYSSVLLDALSAEPKLRSHVLQIQKAGERAASLTRQLLAFSRKQTIQPVTLNLNQAVTGIEQLLHRLIGEHITISTNLAPDLGLVKADPGQIEQIILNLAVNARDAMPKGGILKLETRNVEIQEDEREARSNLKAGPYVELIVTDTGIGMDISVQAHIFEPFYTTKPIGKGTGLGLSTVYGIVQQAQGATVFSSQPGAGSTFRVFLPRIDSSPSLKKTDAPTDISMTGTETILLVEDDHSVCELVRSVLSSHGYAVLFSSRPQEAEALCDSHNGKIDLLLTDVVMPEMSGAELSKRILGKKPSIKVLFMSGYIDDSIVRAGVEENEVAFLQKPFSPHGLAQKVRAVLDAAPARKLV